MQRAIYLMVTALFLTAPQLLAQGAQGKERAQPSAVQRAQAALGPEGITLDIVQVPPGWGDGRVTERDALALAKYCVWGISRLLEDDGSAIRLGDDAEARMLDFWVYVWEHVDQETKQVISAADMLWPAIENAYGQSNPAQRRAIVAQFAEFAEEIWGGLEDETVQYLAGQLHPQQYAYMVDQVIAARAARGRADGGGGGGGGRGGGGGGVGSSLDVFVNYDQNPTEGSSEIPDGSGDMVYLDPQ